MSTWWTAAALGGVLLLAHGPAQGQPMSAPMSAPISAPTSAPMSAPMSAPVSDPTASDPVQLGRAQDDFLRLRAELDRANAAVAELKRANRSVRNDYRLRERMADAEALAQKVTAAESRLRRLRGDVPSPSRNVVMPPQPSPQDGSVELEAKADLFADQAKRLLVQADTLSKAAQQIRSRKALRRQAGAWDRDPFAGLESSKRSLAISAAKVPVASPSSTDGARGATGAVQPPPTLSVGGNGTSASGPTGAMTPVTTTDSKGAPAMGSAESATAAKSTPLPASSASERLAIEQRLFLDPATASELRQALGSVGGDLNADALEQAAALLRSRARGLDAQARALLAKSRAP